MTISTLLNEIKKFESLLEDDFGATGSNFRDKIVTSANQLPKGIVEKLTYLAGLCERAKAGESLSAAELKQAGFYIQAIYPYVTNGARRGTNWKSRLVWIVVLLAAFAFAYKYLH